VLARAYYGAVAAFLQRVEEEAAAAAGEVVLAKAGKQQVPLWAVQDENIKVRLVLQRLQDWSLFYVGVSRVHAFVCVRCG
jgi:hypothetical protein